jgi:hypothetical protein
MYRSALGESASKQQQKPQPQLTVSHVKQWAAQTLGQSQQSLPEGDAGQLEAAPDVSDTEEQEDAAPSTASRSGAQASNTATLSLLQPQQYHLRVQQGVNQRRQPGEQAAAQEYEIELGQYSFLRVRNIKARKWGHTVRPLNLGTESHVSVLLCNVKHSKLAARLPARFSGFYGDLLHTKSPDNTCTTHVMILFSSSTASKLGCCAVLHSPSPLAGSENLCTRGRGGLWDAGARTCTVLEYLSALCFKVQLDGGHYR